MKTVQWLALSVVLGCVGGCTSWFDRAPKAEPFILANPASAAGGAVGIAAPFDTNEEVTELPATATINPVNDAELATDTVGYQQPPPDTPRCDPETGQCFAYTVQQTSVPVPRIAAPYQAQIIDTYVTATDAEARRGNAAPKWQRQHVCGASLIAQDWVITAAHCFNTDARSRSGRLLRAYRSCATDKQFKDIDTDRFVVRVGISNIARDEGQIREIESISCRDYSITPKSGDLALVKLKPRGQPLKADEIAPQPPQPIYKHLSFDRRSGSLLAHAAVHQRGNTFVGVQSWDVQTGLQRRFKFETYTPQSQVKLVAPGRVRIAEGAALKDFEIATNKQIAEYPTALEIRGFKEFKNANRVLVWTRGESGPDQIEVWDRRRMRLLARLDLPYLDIENADDTQPIRPSPVADVFLTPNGSIVAVLQVTGVVVWPKTNGKFGQPRQYDSETRTALEPAKALAGPAAFDWPILSDDKQYMLIKALASDQLIRINLASNRQTQITLPSHRSVVKANADTSRVAVRSDTSSLQLYDMNTGRSLFRDQPTQSVRAFDFSAGGRRLLALYGENKISIWNSRTGTSVRELEVTEQVELIDAKFLDDAGLRVLAQAQSGVSYIWTLNKRAPPLRLDHALPVSRWLVTDDGERLLTGNRFGNAAVWNTKTGAAIVQVFQKGEVESLGLIDDETLLVSTDNGRINFWDLNTGKLTMRLDQDGRRFNPARLQAEDSKLGYIAPDYIAQSEKSRSDTLLVFGWGRTGISGTQRQESAVLRMTGLSALSPAQCAERLRTTQSALDPTFFCAQSEQRKTCVGDSGGPVISGGLGTSSLKTLVGVVSGSNHNCTTDNAPGFYTDVGRYFGWIMDTICADPRTGQRALHLCGRNRLAF